MRYAGLIVLIALVAAAAIGRRLLRYPGQWRHAFGGEYDEHRRDLDSARDRLASLQRDAKREHRTAASGVDAAASAYRRRVRDAEARLAALRDPGRGNPRGELGALRLHQYTLQVTTGGRTGEYPLDELSIRPDPAGAETHVHLILPKGRQQVLPFPREDYPEAAVRAFVADVHDAVAAAKRAKAERETLVPEAEAELAEALADTAGQQHAKRHLADVEARHEADPRIPEARRELDAARDRWHHLTGRRPR
ncbi:hypothetical protein [Kitasatospora terrestris]|uniref:Secreted protein n=1 Tax=Kitasatospora terrestris TaxID=258051 RepID=A0ABP9D7U2_9ACTN